MSKTYADKLTDSRWQHTRWYIIRRDGGRCTRCMSSHNLQAHHLEYIDSREPWDYPEEMLTTLCRRCHAAVSGIVAGHFTPVGLLAGKAIQALKGLEGSHE